MGSFVVTLSMDRELEESFLRSGSSLGRVPVRASEGRDAMRWRCYIMGVFNLSSRFVGGLSLLWFLSFIHMNGM